MRGRPTDTSSHKPLITNHMSTLPPNNPTSTVLPPGIAAALDSFLSNQEAAERTLRPAFAAYLTLTLKDKPGAQP